MSSLYPPQPNPDPAAVRQWMSALADGQSDVLPSACAAWASDSVAREAWHDYHLIGDVLRSEDLATAPARDEAFLAALRVRLAREPAIVAPTPVTVAASAAAALTLPAAGRTPPRRWAVAAAAAGVMLVGGVVVMLREGAPSGAAWSVAPQPTAVAERGQPAQVTTVGLGGIVSTPASAALGDPQWRVLDGKVIRDARLDAYLRAHRGSLAVHPRAVGGRYDTVVLER